MGGAEVPVIWTRTAREDLDVILEYVAVRSLDEAKSVLKKIQKRVETLESMPDRGRTIPELRAQGISSYRETIEGPWRIIYNFTGAAVFLLAVLDSRRNLEDLLLARFIR